MNALEIDAALTELFAVPFVPEDFAWSWLAAFGNKDTTIKRLQKGDTNATDMRRAGVHAVLQRNNIHLAVCPSGDTTATLDALRNSPATTKARARFLLATDGVLLLAEDLISGDTLACDYPDLPAHFGLFLPLAGISTTREIKENPIDVRATARLNKLYLQLLKDNPDWVDKARQHDMNHLMARLIFCFFAEDTQILPRDLFTRTVEQMSDKDGDNTAHVIGEIFRAMNLDPPERRAAGVPNWAMDFPYVNGGLFGDQLALPRFGRLARSYLISAGRLDWKAINPDIFGSMIQAVTEESERAALGMHYTSVPNILKVLNPLFLDDVRAELARADHSPQKLLNLRKRICRIRVFDPACGSGNFLVIAYKQLRAIEATINQRRNEPDAPSQIPLTNFRGIELRDFPAEIARLALIIAEYQCDELYRGQNLALAEFLPLKQDNWIRCGNALRMDWLAVCPPEGKTPIKAVADDLFATPLDQPTFDFENTGGETYICGNPPYLGSTWQSAAQKDDLKAIFDHRCKSWKSLDYVAGWFMKAADYAQASATPTTAAFVSTNSICQGQQVPILWPLIFDMGLNIEFAYTSFKWANLASHNAGVTVVIVAIGNQNKRVRKIFAVKSDDDIQVKEVENINAYLVGGANVIVEKSMQPLTEVSMMDFGNKADDGGHLTLSSLELENLGLSQTAKEVFIKQFYGSKEFINGDTRYCIWVTDRDIEAAQKEPAIAKKIEDVRRARLESKDAYARSLAARPHQFKTPRIAKQSVIVTPRVSSENRPYLPVGVMSNNSIIGDRNFALYDAPLWNMALIASRLHWVWIGTVCVRMRTDFSYSNTLGWNTFPVPTLTEQNKIDLTRAAEDILLAREAHFPATIADLYDPDTMPDDLRAAHERNDEIIERIYIGRRFKNDSERLEKLFDLYTRMTAKTAPASPARTASTRSASAPDLLDPHTPAVAPATDSTPKKTSPTRASSPDSASSTDSSADTVKALSVRQPWAHLIAIGSKTLEIRSRPTQYRGPLCIVASRGGDTTLINLRPSDTDTVTDQMIAVRDLRKAPIGVTVAMVELTGCRPYTIEDAAAAHIDPEWAADCIGQWVWELAHAVPLEPVPVVGKVNFFNIPRSKVRPLADADPLAYAQAHGAPIRAIPPLPFFIIHQNRHGQHLLEDAWYDEG